MLRAASWLLAALLAASLSACATYRDDLDRAMGHYQSKKYDNALALLVALEPDIDSLSEPERAQYAYYRGMSHFLLGQRHDARHWLGRAAARDDLIAEDPARTRATAALRPDEREKADETLGELNEERYGGAKTTTANDPKSCDSDDDCGEAQFCDGGSCAKVPREPEASDSPTTDDEPDPKEPASGNKPIDVPSEP